MKSKLERCEEALREISAHTHSALWSRQSIEDMAEAALNPPPKVEDWHVEVWAVVDSTNGHVLNTGTKDEMEICCDTKSPSNLLKVIPLIGTYQRAKKQPVEHTLTGQFQLNGTFRADGIPTNAHYSKCVTITWEE